LSREISARKQKVRFYSNRLNFIKDKIIYRINGQVKADTPRSSDHCFDCDQASILEG